MLIDRCREWWVLMVMWSALPGIAATADPVIDVPLVEDHVRQLIQDRDWAAAIVAIDQELAQEHVQADRLLYLKGRVRHYQGEYDSAVAVLDELQNRFPDSPWAQRARFAVGAALVGKGDFDGAAVIYRSTAESLLAPRRKQEFADLYLEYADASFNPSGELDEPDYQRALSFYEKALDAGPAPDRRLDVALRIARCHQLLGATSRAGELYGALTDSHPDAAQVVEAQFRMGECYFAEKNWRRARHVWQDLLAAHAESSSPWVAEASFHLARTWGVPHPETDEQMYLGVAACRDFLERFSTHERAGQAHVDIAESLIARGQFGDAARQLQSMLADPQLETSDQVPRARRRLGHALIMQERLSEALATWREFLVQHPSDPAWSDVQRLVIDAQYSIAAEMVEHKLLDVARQLFQEFLAKYPLDARAPEIMFLFGQMRYDEEMWENAINEWRRLVAKFPDTSDAARARLRIAGVLEEKLGDFPAALEEYRKVVGSDYTHEAQTAVARLTSPTLSVVTSRVYRSNETPRLALTTRNIPSVTVRAYQINAESYFRKMYVIGDVEALDIALIDPDASFVFEIPLYEEYRLFNSSVEIPLPAAADGGAIAVTVSTDTLEATTLVVQSDLDMIVKAARNEMFVFAQHMLTQQPWPGVRLLLSDGRRVFAEAMTGPDGVFHASYDQLGDVPDVRVLAIAEAHIASNVIGLEGISVAQGRVDKGYIYTDRPVYRPGQPVHVRGCLRQVIDGDLAVEAGKPYELEVSDPRDRVIWRQTVVPGEFGTLHTSFRLPGTSPPGSYQVRIRQDARRDYRGTFRVAKHQWEPVRISLDVPRRVYYRGEQLEGTIRVQHYYGPPLTDQAITYQLGNDREYTAKTDERGEVRVSVSTRDFHADQVAILEVKLPDHNLGKQYSFYLANQGFSIDLSADRDVFIAGEPCEIVIATRDAEGHPVSEQLNLRVLKVTTVAGKIDESPIEEHAVETGKGTGIARHTIQLEKGGHYRLRAAGDDRRGNPITGQIEVLVSDDADPERLRILADRHTYQAGDDGEVRLLWREKPALALVTFEADHVLDYRLMQLETGVNVLPITADPRWAPNFELHASVMVDVEPTRADGEPDDPVTDVPSRPRFHTASTALTVERALQVSMSYSGSDGATGPLVPGEPLEVTIRTTDPQGRPVPAEVSLVMFERASLAGPEQSLPTIDHFFRGDRRTVAPRTVSSVAFAYPPDTAATDVGPIAVHHRAESEPPRAVAGWQEHPDHAQASVSVTQHDGGPVADPFAFGPPSAPTAAIGTKPLSSGLDSPPPNPLSIWGYTIRFETPTPAAPKPLAKLPGMPMPGMPISAVSFPRESIARPHLLDVEVPPVPDPIFEGAWDIADRGPDGAPRAPGETVYWNPVIVTDNQGTATVLIEMPRRATVWTMVAKGITKDALAGEAIEKIVSQKDLFGRLRLPGTLVEGDRAEIVAAVRNDKVTDGSVDVILTTSIGGHSVEQAKRVDVTSTGVIEVPFHVSLDRSTESAGHSEWDLSLATNVVFRLTVSAGDVTDVFERSVPLTPRGIAAVVSIGGVADSDATAWIEAPPGAPVAASRMRVIVGPSVSSSLLDIVSSLTDRYEQKAIPVASTTDTLSGNLMAMLGIQQAYEFTPDSDDPRARSLDASIRSTIGQLVTAQNTDGGWGWSVGNPVSDRYASARAVWSLSLSRRAGYWVPDSGHQQSVQYLTSQITVTEADDNESKAVLLHALCMAGKPNFSLGNRLYRERLSLSTPALLYLCLALAEMDRGQMAGELLSLIDRVPSEHAGGLERTSAAPHACHKSPLHDLALHAVALQQVAPETPKAQELIDLLWAARTGSRWSPDQATGPAAWALCRWVARNPFEADRYQLTVSVNDRQLQVWDLDATESSRVVDVPAHLLVEGKQRVHFQIEGRGRFTYQVALSGSLAEEGLRSTTDSWRVNRTYTPAPLERDGREIPRGFANVRGVTDPFVNPLTELPVDRRGQVELSVTRDVPDAVPNESLEYLVITEPIPAGAFVLPMSVRGSFERVEFAPGSITFHVGNRRQVEPIHYELCGHLAGDYHVARTVVRDAYRPDRMAVADPARLKVVPAGTPSADPYRLSPQELYELGARSFQQRDWPAAESLLTELISEWSLQGPPYRDTVSMLLDIALERNASDRVMRYFEIIFEQWPDDEIPLAKALRIGSAYHALGEHERGYLVFRAAVEGIFAREGGVAGMLASQDESLRSIEVMRELVRDYPPEPYVAKAHSALAQRVYALAPEVENNPRLRKAGVTREGLITAAWRMLEDFLTEYPLDPAADQAAFAAANALLEAKQYAEAAEAGQRYGSRYPQSDLLNHFRFIVGFSRFALGQHDLAAAVLHEVAASEPGRKRSGEAAESDNKWSAIYILGQIHHSLGEVAEAIRMYRMVEDRYPDAKQSIQQFLREMIRLPEVTTVRPGSPVEVELAYRNIAACDLKIYRIDLMKFAQLRHGLAGIRDINLAGIEPQHEMIVELGDGEDYRIRTRRLTLDLTEQSAYLLVCRGGGQFASGLVVITPLGIEVHHEPVAGEVRAIVKDLTTDQHVYAAQVQVIGAEGADIVSGETDRRGLFVANGIFRRPTVIAQAGPGKYAFHRDAVTTRSSAPEAGRATPLLTRAAAPPTMSSDRRPEKREVGVVVAGPGADPEEQRIEALLDTVVSVTFQDTPLEEVARAITREHNFTVRVNRRALEDVGLSADEPISVDVRNLTLRSALRLILEPLDLTYVLRHESLTITTAEDAETQLTTVLYPVTDLVRFRDPEGTIWSDYDTLIGTITSTVTPDSWEDVGGSGFVDGMRYQDTDVLIVAQRQDAHEHIASLLETLRSVTRTDTADGELPIKERSEAAGSRASRGGIGGGMGGFGAAAAGDGLRFGLPGRPLPPAAGAGLLQGLEETKRRLQGTQQDELQRIYEQGKGGMGGGIGAGGMF